MGTWDISLKQPVMFLTHILWDISLSFTLWEHLSLFALWGHRTTLKPVMFFSHLHCGDVFSHLHCGDIGYFFKEDSHVSLSYTLYVGHCSLIYTVRTFLSLCTVGT